jgi:hypothetical protein
MQPRQRGQLIALNKYSRGLTIEEGCEDIKVRIREGNRNENLRSRAAHTLSVVVDES